MTRRVRKALKEIATPIALTKSEPYTDDDFVRARQHPVRTVVGGAVAGTVVGALLIPDGVSNSGAVRLLIGGAIGLCFGALMNVVSVLRGSALRNPKGTAAKGVRVYQRLAGYPPDSDEQES